MHKPLIIAHRGASAVAPENTLAAFRRAVEAGADGVECDVRLAGDGTVVVFHDPTLRRLAGRKTPVARMSAAELAETDVGAWFARRSAESFAGETIPTLRALLAALDGFAGLVYIELKCREAETARLAEAVCEIVETSPLLPQIIVKSFQLEVIPHVRRRLPAVKTAALFAPKIMTLLRKEKRLVNIAADLGAEMLSVHFSLATRKLMKKAAKRGLPVAIWTADNPRWIRRAVNLGLFAVITNDPARMLARRAALVGDAPPAAA